MMSHRLLVSIASVSALWAFTAAHLFIGVVILPFWQGLSHSELTEFFGGPFLRFPMLMVPLNLLAVLLTVAAAYFHRKAESGKRWWVVALLLIFASSITFPLFFAGANTAMADAASSAVTLSDWEAWHWARTILALISAATASYAFMVSNLDN